MPNDALTARLLEWIGERPRAYVETMEAWRTSCPRLSIWENALSRGLIERVGSSKLSDALVQVTSAGKTHLRSATSIRA